MSVETYFIVNGSQEGLNWMEGDFVGTSQFYFIEF